MATQAAETRESNDNRRGDAPAVVDAILERAIQERASDIHLEPTASGYEFRLRVDGMLRPVQTCDASTGRSAVGRFMVLAHLLTYRLDIPQEGRLTIHPRGSEDALDLRLSVMPTTHGLRCVVRLPAELLQPKSLADLSLPEQTVQGLTGFAGSDAGMLLLTGPAGSGKTTTIYALLKHIAEASPGLSIIALEDPVERDLPGVTQIEVSPFGQLTYEKALRSILRQDPQVLMIGEIRDAATASLAVQAALSGHRLISTLHAASAGGAIARLVEMGIEPYQITSALFGVVAQRLIRRRSSEAAMYEGRIPIAEFVLMDAALRKVVLERGDADTLQATYSVSAGYQSLRQSADLLIERRLTDVAEVARVLGVARLPSPVK